MGPPPHRLRLTVPRVATARAVPPNSTTDMYYSELRQLVDQSVEFPVSHEDVVEQLGGVELTAPTGDSVTVTEVLQRTDESVYDSTDMLYTTIVGNLGDAFIGRKHYDDRGGDHTLPDERPGLTF